jgi:glycosyltransferase involved in cell wall biosynthesis
MKKIFINLVPINAGGGLQNAINLIIGISETINKSDYQFLVRNNLLAEFCDKYDLKYIKIKETIISRIAFELFYFLGKKNNVVFTLFGGKPLISNNNTTISGCAFSNLFYPEVNFWGYLPLRKRIIKMIKDYYRFRSIKKSDYVIFETDILRKRAVEIRNFKSDNTFVVKMAVNKLVAETKGKSSYRSLYVDKKKYKILYLGSAHPNKRQHLLINIAKALLKYSDEFCFITTMGENQYSKSVLKEIYANNLDNNIINLGTILSNEVGVLLNEVDAIINIAKLESFSNNFIEAWTFEKPLIVTDADWSRESCLNSALYINPEHFQDTADKIFELMTIRSLSLNLVATYEKTLNSYLDYQMKTMKYIDIIEKIRKGV